MFCLSLSGLFFKPSLSSLKNFVIPIFNHSLIINRFKRWNPSAHPWSFYQGIERICNIIWPCQWRSLWKVSSGIGYQAYGIGSRMVGSDIVLFNWWSPWSKTKRIQGSTPQQKEKVQHWFDATNQNSQKIIQVIFRLLRC